MTKKLIQWCKDAFAGQRGDRTSPEPRAIKGYFLPLRLSLANSELSSDRALYFGRPDIYEILANPFWLAANPGWEQDFKRAALRGGNRRAAEFALALQRPKTNPQWRDLGPLAFYMIDSLDFTCPDEESAPFLEWMLSQGAELRQAFTTTFAYLFASACKNQPRPKFIQHLLSRDEFKQMLGSIPL